MRLTDRQILEVVGRRLLTDDGKPASPPARPDARPPTPEEAKGQYLTFCMTFMRMSEAQAEAAYQEAVKRGQTAG